MPNDRDLDGMVRLRTASESVGWLNSTHALALSPGVAIHKEALSLKNREGKDNKSFWEFIERTARDVRNNRPSWALPETERTTMPMLPTDVILSIIDSVLKIALIELNALPEPQKSQQALQVQADVNWWRSLLHLPTGAQIPALPATGAPHA